VPHLDERKLLDRLEKVEEIFVFATAIVLLADFFKADAFPALLLTI